jgi:hypothetical protein
MKIIIACIHLIFNLLMSIGPIEPAFSVCRGQSTFQTSIILGNREKKQAQVYRVTFDCNSNGCNPRPLQPSDLQWSSPYIPGISEVKYVMYKGQQALLATTDNGAIVYAYPSGNVLFYKEIVGKNLNIHSAEVLPDGNVVVAGSISQGTYSILYPNGSTVNQDFSQTVSRTNGRYAHAVVYDKVRKRLYAAGYLTFLALEYSSGRDGRGAFKVINEFSLTNLYDTADKNEDDNNEDGVHDMYPVDGTTDTLFISTGEHVFTVNVDSFVFTRHPNFYTVPSWNGQQGVAVKNKGGVKGVSNDASNGLVIAKPAPWFKDSRSNYGYFDPIVLWSMANKCSDPGYCPNPDYDLTKSCKLNFDNLKPITFYKARIFKLPTFSF